MMITREGGMKKNKKDIQKRKGKGANPPGNICDFRLPVGSFKGGEEKAALDEVSW